MRARVRVPGTCGELVQGTMNGINFHITCPVNLYAEVTVLVDGDQPEILYPAGFSKAAKGIRATLQTLGLEGWGATLIVHNSLPMGKGMASSTADIVAACFAAAAAAGRQLEPCQAARIALDIEPSDGIMFPGIVLFDHVKGKLMEDLGEIKGLEVMMVDLGGRVNTQAFNNRADLAEANKAKENAVLKALDMVRAGIKKQDLSLIGAGATISSKANQQILYKQELSLLEEIVREMSLLGLNIAHSGTVVGLLFEKGTVDGVKLEEKLRCRIGRGLNIYHTALVSGGAQVIQKGKGENKWKASSTSMGEISGRPLKSLV